MGTAESVAQANCDISYKGVSINVYEMYNNNCPAVAVGNSAPWCDLNLLQAAGAARPECVALGNLKVGDTVTNVATTVCGCAATFDEDDVVDCNVPVGTGAVNLSVMWHMCPVAGVTTTCDLDKVWPNIHDKPECLTLLADGALHDATIEEACACAELFTAENVAENNCDISYQGITMNLYEMYHVACPAEIATGQKGCKIVAHTPLSGPCPCRGENCVAGQFCYPDSPDSKCLNFDPQGEGSPYASDFVKKGRSRVEEELELAESQRSAEYSAPTFNQALLFFFGIGVGVTCMKSILGRGKRNNQFVNERTSLLIDEL